MSHFPVITGLAKRLGVSALIDATTYDWNDMVQYKLVNGFAVSAMSADPITFLFPSKNNLPPWFGIDGIIRSVEATFNIAKHVCPSRSPTFTQRSRHFSFGFFSVLEYPFLRAGAFRRVSKHVLRQALTGFDRMSSAKEVVTFTTLVDSIAGKGTSKLSAFVNVVLGTVVGFLANWTSNGNACFSSSHAVTCKSGENGETLFSITP
jgi:hypothetical protein